MDIVFPEGSIDGTTRCIGIPILEDPHFEGDHTFRVEISSVSPDIVDTPIALVGVTIVDDGKMLYDPL